MNNLSCVCYDLHFLLQCAIDIAFSNWKSTVYTKKPMLGVQTKDLYKLWGFLLILCIKLNSVLKIQYCSDSQWFYPCTVSCVKYLIFNGNQCLMKCGYSVLKIIWLCMKVHCMDPVSVVVLVIGLLYISSVKCKCFASRIPVLDCIFKMNIHHGLSSTCWERNLLPGYRLLVTNM